MSSRHKLRYIPILG